MGRNDRRRAGGVAAGVVGVDGWPGVALAVTILGLNLVGDWLAARRYPR